MNSMTISPDQNTVKRLKTVFTPKFRQPGHYLIQSLPWTVWRFPQTEVTTRQKDWSPCLHQLLNNRDESVISRPFYSHMVNLTKMSKCDNHLKEMVAALFSNLHTFYIIWCSNHISIFSWLDKGKTCKDTRMNNTQSENMNFGLQINQYILVTNELWTEIIKTHMNEWMIHKVKIWILVCR